MLRGTETQMAISPEDKVFFKKLGKKITKLRNDRGLTQVQLAEILGISQQQMQSFEVGRRRVPVSALPRLSKALGVSVEELVGTAKEPSKRGPTPKLQRQLEQLQQLPRNQQRFVSQMLDTVLQQAGR